MAFNDDPIIDKFSESCEESVNAVKSLFTQKRGFICREESPDKGTDLNIEIINLDNSTNTGQKFPVQIKSIQNILITGKTNKFISYNIKTSRIGFFSRIIPTYGLFIFYDVKKSVLYYDFTEKIIERLDDQRKDDWRSNDTVRVNIPIENILDQNELKNIYSKINLRFENTNILIQNEGMHYQIPSFHRFEKSSYSKEDIINDIENCGLGYLLFNEKRFDLLDNIFNELTKNRIENSSTLSLLAFVTYCELGRGIDSKYYLSKAKKLIKYYNEVEEELLKVYELKLKFIFGEIETIDYINGLKEVSALMKDSGTRLSIESSIIQLNLISNIKKDNYCENNNIDEEILEKISQIDHNTNINDSTKHYLKIYLTDTLHLFTSNLFIDISRVIKTQRLQNLKVDYRNDESYKIPKYVNIAREILINARFFANEHSDSLLNAEAGYRLGYQFIQYQMNLILIDELNDIDESINSNYISAYNFLGESYNIYNTEGKFFECHKTLLLIYELKVIYRHLTNLDIGNISFDSLLNNIRKLEDENGFKTFNSVMTQVITELNSKRDPRKLKDYSENEVKNFVNLLMLTYNLPEKCKANLWNSINDRIFFDTNIKSDRYVLLEKGIEDKVVLYSNPVFYIILDSKTGMSSLESTNVKELMKGWGLI